MSCHFTLIFLFWIDFFPLFYRRLSFSLSGNGFHKSTTIIPAIDPVSMRIGKQNEQRSKFARTTKLNETIPLLVWYRNYSIIYFSLHYSNCRFSYFLALNYFSLQTQNLINCSKPIFFTKLWINVIADNNNEFLFKSSTDCLLRWFVTDDHNLEATKTAGKSRTGDNATTATTTIKWKKITQTASARSTHFEWSMIARVAHTTPHQFTV